MAVQETISGSWISATTPVEHGAAIPSAVDVAVIGGGAIGMFTALYLRRAGLRVAVLEKGRVAGEQSSRNWGWVRQQGREEAEVPIASEAIKLWHQIDAQMARATGFKQTGVLYLASTRREMDKHEKWMQIARRHGLDTRLLTPAEIDGLIDRRGTNGPRHEWIGGMYTASDGRAEPWQAVPAVARLAAGEGVSIHENCAVRGLDLAGGRIAGVHTEQGRIACSAVVLAGGSWSSLFLRRHGVSIPQLSVKSIVARTTPMPDFFPGNAVDEDFAFRRREDGGYSIALGDWHQFFIGPDSFRHLFAFLPTLRDSFGQTQFLPAAPRDYPDAWGTKRQWGDDEISPFERCRVLDPAPPEKTLARIRALFAQRFPHLGEPRLVNAWAGMIDTLPDVLPIVDHVPQFPGLIVATGMSGHGFGIAPAFGRIIADMAQGRPAGHDMKAFAHGRFG